MAGTIKKFIVRGYSLGLVSNIGYCIYEANKTFEDVRNDIDSNNNICDLGHLSNAKVSFEGAIIGLLTGVVWPITVFGRLSLMLTPKS